MKYKKILGFSTMLIGFIMTIGSILILDKLTEPIKTIFGLSIFFCFALPLILGGSIISDTAPDFVMKRFEGVNQSE